MAHSPLHCWPAAALLACTGCATVHTPYAPPRIATAPQWTGGAAANTADAAGGRWWTSFGDPALDTLVERVLASNADLAAAGITLRKARLAAQLAARQRVPDIGASAGTGYSRTLGDQPTGTESATGSLSVAWEADLFGKLAAQRDSARWEEQATAQDLAATRLSLIASTAKYYWQLGYASESVAVGAQSLAYARRVRDLVELQYRAGAVSRVELLDAEQSVSAQEASQTQLVQSVAAARNALAALLGQQVYDGPAPDRLPRTTLPAVNAGLPATLLSRRPDLAAAELRLRGTLADVDATRASYYPQLSLTGALGTASAALLNVLSNPVASLSGALSIATLDPARIRLNIGVSRATYDAAVQRFRQDMVNALRDVETALSARQHYLDQGAALERSFAEASAAERLYERQYRAGATGLRAWLDAQERRRSAENALLSNRLARLTEHVTLYEALGGDAAPG